MKPRFFSQITQNYKTTLDEENQDEVLPHFSSLFSAVAVADLKLSPRYVNILNRTNNKQYSLNEELYENNTKHESSRLTMKQIFELTPVPSDIISGCFVRRPDLLEMKDYNQRVCNYMCLFCVEFS